MKNKLILGALIAVCWCVPAYATDYYLAVSGGSDSGACTSSASPCASISYVFGQIGSGSAGAGDTLYVCPSSPCATGSATMDGPWDLNDGNSPEGTDKTTNTFTIRPFTGATITLEDAVGCNNIIDMDDDVDYVTWREFTVNMASACNNGVLLKNGADNNVFIDMDIDCNGAEANGWVTRPTGADPSADSNELRDTSVHDCGTATGQHCIYIETPNNIVDGGEFYNCQGFGVHIYSASGGSPHNNIVRGARIHDNVQGGIAMSTGSAAGSDGILVYNNWLWDNDSSGSLLNTIQVGVSSSYGCLNGAGSVDCLVANNTMDGDIHITNSSEAIEADFLCNIRDNWTDDKTTETETDGITFASVTLVSKTEGSEDFHLLATDTAALELCDPNSSGTFTTDYDGDTRPSGTTWDIGADEYLQTSPPGAARTIFVPARIR